MKKKSKLVPSVWVQVTKQDGKVNKIGKYFPDKKLFVATRERSIHLMKKWNAWGIDAKVLEFLVGEQATIKIKDKETKQEFEILAVDLKLKGKIGEFNQHRPQVFLNVNEWEIVKTKNRSYIIECLEKDCTHNVVNHCLKGVVKIGASGECVSYKDK